MYIIAKKSLGQRDYSYRLERNIAQGLEGVSHDPWITWNRERE